MRATRASRLGAKNFEHKKVSKGDLKSNNKDANSYKDAFFGKILLYEA